MMAGCVLKMSTVVVLLGWILCGASWGLDWNYEVVAQDASHPSMALDLSGNLHMTYNRFISTNFGYASWTGTQWVTQDVAPGAMSSLEFDSQGRPHIAYSTAGEVNYAVDYGSGWVTEQVEGPQCYVTSMALDVNDHPHITAWDNQLMRTRYMVRSGAGAWSAETVGPAGYGKSFSNSALEFDAGGVPHIAGALPGSSLALAWRGPGGWDIETIPTTGGSGASLVFDANDRPHIAHSLVNADVVKYTWWDGAVWQTQLVDDSGLANCWGDENIALDSHGRPHICYFRRSDDVGNGDVNYARWTGQAWEIETIAADKSGGGYHFSILVDAQDIVHIGYSDLDTLELVHAWAQIPEPATLSFLTLGGLAVLRRRSPGRRRLVRRRKRGECK